MTKRFERQERKGIKITERDFATIEAVFTARYLTNRQIASLFYPATAYSHCKQRLRYLYDKGYLAKRAAYPNEPDIYFLGLKGRNWIAKHRHLPKEWVDKVAGVSGGSAAAPFLMMRHELTVSDLYVAARKEASAYGWELEWKNARALELEGLGVQPDGHLLVSRDGRSKAAFLEFTSVMPEKPEMERRLAGYGALFDKRGEATAVMWLTTSLAKANRLVQAIASSRYQSYFLVGLLENTRRLLTDEIWRWSGGASGKLVRFIKPPEAIIYGGG